MFGNCKRLLQGSSHNKFSIMLHYERRRNTARHFLLLMSNPIYSSLNHVIISVVILVNFFYKAVLRHSFSYLCIDISVILFALLWYFIVDYFYLQLLLIQLILLAIICKIMLMVQCWEGARVSALDHWWIRWSI